MAIHQEVTTEISGGFSKEIDAGAQGMIFDNLQRFQYQYPIKSTIREIVSNGLDSIREKNVAVSILTGKAKVEDHFVEREGAVFKDSRFDPNYYSLNFLSTEDTVEIIYQDGGEMGKDMLVIRDHGVGLGGDRLKGYFNLGYSSKRLNKFALGKFGLGAKSPLSTGAPFYTVVSRFNGMEFCFNIYNHKVESIVPQYDLEKMIENPTFTWPATFTEEGIKTSNEVTVHYKRTAEKNMLEIRLHTKKHHKQQYIDAVTSQLLYFTNVKLYTQNTSGDNQLKEIPIKAQIMFEDDLIVLSNNSPYNKPHLILNGVNYGYIDFRELELEEKLGNIGIKVSPEFVSITPSRESLIWDEVTRQVVIDKFNEVVGIAEKTISAELQERDFIKWLKVCSTMSASGRWWNSSKEDSVIGRLAQVVDMSKVKLAYPLNPIYRFSHNILAGVRVHRVSSEKTRKGSKTYMKIEYNEHWDSALSQNFPIVVQHKATSNRKNKFIMKHLYPQGFILIRLDTDRPMGEEVLSTDLFREEMITEAHNAMAKRFTRQDAAQRIADLHNYIRESKAGINYENIAVPDDFVATEEEEELMSEDTVETVEAELSAAERRKLTGSTIIHTPRICDKSLDTKLYEMNKVEVPAHLIDTWQNEEVYWSNQDFEKLMHTVAIITRPFEEVRKYAPYDDNACDSWKNAGYTGSNRYEFQRIAWFHENSPVRLIKVAQDNVKYYQDFKHITKFFKEIRNKTITMSNALIRWNTARIIKNGLEKLNFLRGFESLDPTAFTKYQSLVKYVEVNWRSLDISTRVTGADETTTGQLISHLDKVGQFQLFVRDNAEDKEAIAELAKRMFNPQPGVEIEDGLAIEPWAYDLFMKFTDWAQPVECMLNMVNPLVEGLPFSQEQEEAIRSYFKYRDCPLSAF
jgi:hypothetical protein